MSEETISTQELLKAALGDILDTARDAADFAVGELPLVVNEILVYYFWYSCVWFVVSVAAVLGCVQVSRWVVKQVREVDEEYSMLFMLILPVMVGFIIVLCRSFATALQIQLAPRLYIIEYVRDFV